jgi:hypothetical protein
MRRVTGDLCSFGTRARTRVCVNPKGKLMTFFKREDGKGDISREVEIASLGDDKDGQIELDLSCFHLAATIAKVDEKVESVRLSFSGKQENPMTMAESSEDLSLYFLPFGEEE